MLMFKHVAIHWKQLKTASSYLYFAIVLLLTPSNCWLTIRDSVLVQQLCLFKYPFYGQYRILQLDYISLALRDCNAQ